MSEEPGMTAVPKLPLGPLTLDDVTAIAEADGRHRFELVEGNLVVMPPGTWRHQQISGLLFTWFQTNGFHDRVNFAPGVRTAADELNGRIPDLVVTTRPVPPDTVWLPVDVVLLAVEIVSKGSERTDRWFKPLEYAAAGIPNFWRVEPDESVLRFRLDGGAYREIAASSLAELLSGAVPDGL
ncbi:hypothetical protein GCM10010399_38930 [Dactylosporangium fulvum]|uniref:Uma2 family endonuclease n=1 Tax=Dactylosporangium fulvum TaxID=53359 RepID=A0ABY5W4G7_9ACTN|nr:Uma2 family endonuclease [Dactylosporangium fulvum]UWP84260.1 Uma2 family endonuclease [Dactylosporangium fulvum]